MYFEETRLKSRTKMVGCRELFCRLGVMPLLFSLCSIVTFIITYSVAVADGHVYPFLPAISDTGGIKPESNIFGFCLSACSFLGFVSVVIRYYQYRFVSENNEEHRPRLVCVNKIALVIGIVSTGGALLVAAFQDRGVSLNMHIVGALAVFGFGVLYCFIQTYLSFKMFACGMNSKRICLIRLTIAFFSLLFFIGNQVFGNLAGQARDRDPPTQKSHDRPHWYPEDAGFKYNVLGNASEWLMALSFFVYFLTFIPEFNKVKMSFSVKSDDYSMLLPFQQSGESKDGGHDDDDEMITA
eukprot:TCONS_00001795-protein